MRHPLLLVRTQKAIKAFLKWAIDAALAAMGQEWAIPWANAGLAIGEAGYSVRARDVRLRDS